MNTELAAKLVTFIVPGVAAPKARARVTKRGTYTPKETRGWEDLVAWQARVAMGSDPPMTGRLEVKIAFYVLRRGSDIDNLAKACLDAMNGIVYKDDSQIDRLELVRAKVEVPNVVIWVEEQRA